MIKQIPILIMIFNAHATCKLINAQCLDSGATKTISGVTYNLKDACLANNLSGVDCCWNLQKQYLCTNSTDTCDTYRHNQNCDLLDNACVDKDLISGKCNKFQSRFACANGYKDEEKKICTNVVCANNDPGTASKCFNPKPVQPENAQNFTQVVAHLQMGQNMAQNMICTDTKDPASCTLFAGKYFTCSLYAFKWGQPGTWNNGGADCMIHHDAFAQAGVPTGYNASDRNLYSQATSGSNSVMGSVMNYSISNDDATAINTTVKLQQQSKSPAVNQDENINYNPNYSRNNKITVQNGQITSVTINKDAIRDLQGLTSFKSYLSDISVNLAWNRQKSEPDPNNIKNITFADEGILRRNTGNSFGWSDSPNNPIINGLCVHFADYCEGGDDEATFSDLVKGEFVYAGGFTNPNFCAKCNTKVKKTCILGEPRPVLQQWCCFNSKVALDINLAAYDQGLLNIYTGGNRYSDQIYHPNNICGGVTVAMISKIDFSKGNYFKDLMDSIDVNRIIDNTNFTNNSIQNNTQNRSNNDAINMVNEWKKKNGN